MDTAASKAKRARIVAGIGGSILLWVVASWFIAHDVTYKKLESQVKDDSVAVKRQAGEVAQNIAQSLNHLHGIPSQLAQDPRTASALRHVSMQPKPASESVQSRKTRWQADPELKQLDEQLSRSARFLGADKVWLINMEGDTIAASNAGELKSFVGENYADREYFQKAMNGEHGQQYAMGRISNVPGLYFSAPVIVDGEIAGVVVAKTDLPKLSSWINQLDAFVTDMNGILIMTNNRAWDMHAMPNALIRTVPERERMARYKRNDFLVLSVEGWKNSRLPGLFQLDNEPVPVALDHATVPDNRISVYVYRAIPGALLGEASALQLFLLLVSSGSVILLIIGGSLYNASIHRIAKLRIARTLSLQRAIVESTVDGIIVIGNDGVVSSYNERFIDIWKLPLEYLESGNHHKVVDFVSAQLIDPESYLDRVREMHESPEETMIDTLYCKDGRVLERYSQPQRLDNVVVGRVVCLRDITERKQAADKLATSELKLQTIVESQPECVKLVAADGTLLQMNRAGLEMIGADSAEQVIGKRVEGIILPEWRADFAALTRRVFEGESGNLEFEIAGFKGEHRWLDTRAVPLRDPQGNITALLGVTRDVTEIRRADQDLRIAATAFETMESLMVTDADSRILKVNDAFTEVTGYTAEDALGKKPSLLSSGRHDQAFYDSMWETLNQTGSWQGEIWNRRKNGDIYPSWMVINAVKKPDGTVTNYVGASTDITERKSSEERIRNLAFFDALTALPNRRLLLERLEFALIRSQRSRRAGAVLFIDLDHFKMLNDTLGHAVGDQLLVEVAKRMKVAVRESDTVSRLGGDEFIILLEGLSEDPGRAAAQARAVAAKILKALAQPYSLVCENDPTPRDFHCSASIGISQFMGESETAEELLKHADVAMYQAKTAGRNAVRFFDPVMQDSLDHKAEMELRLRSALINREFELYYQPQVDDRHAMIGAEVLLRWNTAVLGSVSPAIFIPLAEETGLIVPIGHWVLKSACAQIKVWSSRPEYRDLTIAVNISPRQFRQEDFVQTVLDVLAETGADPTRLKLELTEGLMLDNVESSIQKMHALRELGIEFSMDDFGTGYSSLSYLKRLPLSQLKIDQSFVKDISSDPNDAAIVRTIITMGRMLGLAVIAEGVETEAQRVFLEQNECRAYQGYLFGRPLPKQGFEEMVERYSTTPALAVAGA